MMSVPLNGRCVCARARVRVRVCACAWLCVRSVKGRVDVLLKGVYVLFCSFALN